MQVVCTNGEDGEHDLAFGELYEAMTRSIFCLILPGDAASTRRLSEVFMAGAPADARLLTFTLIHRTVVLLAPSSTPTHCRHVLLAFNWPVLGARGKCKQQIDS